MSRAVDNENAHERSNKLKNAMEMALHIAHWTKKPEYAVTDMDDEVAMIANIMDEYNKGLASKKAGGKVSSVMPFKTIRQMYMEGKKVLGQEPQAWAKFSLQQYLPMVYSKYNKEGGRVEMARGIEMILTWLEAERAAMKIQSQRAQALFKREQEAYPALSSAANPYLVLDSLRSS